MQFINNKIRRISNCHDHLKLWPVKTPTTATVPGWSLQTTHNLKHTLKYLHQNKYFFRRSFRHLPVAPFRSCQILLYQFQYLFQHGSIITQAGYLMLATQFTLCPKPLIKCAFRQSMNLR